MPRNLAILPTPSVSVCYGRFRGYLSMSNEPDKEEPISRETQIRLTEYVALREEILNKMESQRQFLSLAVIGIGTIFLASVQNPNHNTGAILMLGYPLVSLFLAAGWEFQGRRIRQIGTYIR